MRWKPALNAFAITFERQIHRVSDVSKIDGGVNL
jgi:hypothetical protein